MFCQVRQLVPKVSLATVYNTLEAFCRAGLAVKLPGNGASARYDAALHNHAHTRCDKTGAVRDVPEPLSRQLLDQLPQDVLEKIETHLGFNIRHVQIELVGEHQGLSTKASSVGRVPRRTSNTTLLADLSNPHRAVGPIPLVKVPPPKRSTTLLSRIRRTHERD